MGYIFCSAGSRYRCLPNCRLTEESSHKEWHLQACFVLRAVPAEQKKFRDERLPPAGRVSMIHGAGAEGRAKRMKS